MAALLYCTTIFAFAEAGPICDGMLGSSEKNYAYLKWTTDADGNVNIEIMPYNKAGETTDKPTAWRGRGMA